MFAEALRTRLPPPAVDDEAPIVAVALFLCCFLLPLTLLPSLAKELWRWRADAARANAAARGPPPEPCCVICSEADARLPSFAHGPCGHSMHAGCAAALFAIGVAPSCPACDAPLEPLPFKATATCKGLEVTVRRDPASPVLTHAQTCGDLAGVAGLLRSALSRDFKAFSRQQEAERRRAAATTPWADLRFDARAEFGGYSGEAAAVVTAEGDGAVEAAAARAWAADAADAAAARAEAARALQAAAAGEGSAAREQQGEQGQQDPAELEAEYISGLGDAAINVSDNSADEGDEVEGGEGSEGGDESDQSFAAGLAPPKTPAPSGLPTGKDSPRRAILAGTAGLSKVGLMGPMATPASGKHPGPGGKRGGEGRTEEKESPQSIAVDW